MNQNNTDQDITNEEIQVGKQFFEQADLIISVNNYTPSPLTHREEEIVHLVESMPNDMELGRKIREYYHQYLKQT